MEEMQGRVGRLEREFVRIDGRLDTIGGNQSEIMSDVKRLVQREAERPAPISVRAVVATVASVAGVLVMVGGMVWWFIANAPAVQDNRRAIAAGASDLAQIKEDLRGRARDRHTASDELIGCLRNEILNQPLGWRCAHPDRGVPQSLPASGWSASVNHSGS